MKVFSVWYDSTRMFVERGYEATRVPDEADIIVLNGGEDIATEFYGETPIDKYWSPASKTRRDVHEEAAAKFAIENGKFLFGICRGAQMLNCLNGGKMWQHVNGHGNDHPIIDLASGRILTTTSVHHQMMIPTDEAEIIAVASESTYKVKEGVHVRGIETTTELRDGKDPEILWYPKTRSLCIQGHPEYHLKPFTDYCFEVMERCMAAEQQAALSA